MFCERTQRFLGERNSFVREFTVSLGNVIVWRENATFLKGTQYFWKESTNVSQGNAIIL